MRMKAIIAVCVVFTGMIVSVFGTLMIGGAIVLAGVVLWAMPRQSLPWQFGIVRWLFGSYCCDVMHCKSREGFGPERDLRSGSNLVMKMIEIRGGDLMIAGVRVPMKVRHDRWAEIRICGIPEKALKENHQFSAVQFLCIEQDPSSHVIRLWFSSAAHSMEERGALPAVSYRLARRVLATLSGLSPEVIEREVKIVAGFSR